ncbi:MAG: hypothetical protein RR521_12640 [Clostridia bacterium]
MTTPINIWPMAFSILLSIFLSIMPITVAQDSQIAQTVSNEANGFDVIMGTAGNEIMLDDTFLGTAWIYQYASREAMQQASQALSRHLKELGYAASEATLEELPAIRFVKEGNDNIMIAPHTAYPFVYVIMGKFTTDDGYVVVEENGVTHYQDIAGQFCTTLNHADVFIDGEKVEGFNACFTSINNTHDQISFSCGKPEYTLAITLPLNSMAGGGLCGLEQLRSTELDCRAQMGGGNGAWFSEKPERFHDVSFAFSSVSHDKPVSVYFSLSYTDQGHEYLVEGFAVVLYQVAFT